MGEQHNISEKIQKLMEATRQPTGPFFVPENYLPEIDNQILAKVAALESEELPIAPEGKNQTYTVPGQYFESLNKSILEKTSRPQGRLFSLRKWQATAAAAVTGIIVLGSVYFLRDSPSQPIALQNKFSPPASIQNIEGNELNDFAEDNASGNLSANNNSTVDINQLFQQVSSQDLENFLNEKTSIDKELF